MDILKRIGTLLAQSGRAWYRFVTSRKTTTGTVVAILGSLVVACCALSVITAPFTGKAAQVPTPTRAPTTTLQPPTLTPIPASATPAVQPTSASTLAPVTPTPTSAAPFVTLTTHTPTAIPTSVPTTGPTAEPTLQPSITTKPVQAPVQTQNFDTNGDGKVTCADFTTRAQAQAALAAGYTNLDSDHDGIPCEKLH